MIIQENHFVDQTRRSPGDISVIVCAYTEERWEDLLESVASIRAQTIPPKELILVIDYNQPLFERARRQFPDVTVIENQATKGLAGARNSGIAAASGSIIAFIDEDAAAEPDWLECLLEGYADPNVIGVGGSILPNWETGQPAWFPDEFLWVVGCTYQGMPETAAPVRNLIGANMSFRGDLLKETGGFRVGLGRVNTLPLGCEETELCIRALQTWQAAKFLYNPLARVQHRVPAKRGTFRYFTSRCYSEGISKAMVADLVGANQGLSSERRYTLRTLPRGILRGLSLARKGYAAGFGQAASIIAGLGITTFGYLTGTARRWYGRLRYRSTPQEGAEAVNPIQEARAQIPATGPSRSYPASQPRILMVTPRFFPDTGGVENHVYEVARRLVDKSVPVTVLTTDPSGKLPTQEVIDGIHVERVRAMPKSADLYFAPGIISVIQRGNWDLIHIQSYHTLVPPLAMLAALQAKIPYVVTFHGGGHSSRTRNAVRGFQRALLGPLLRRAARLVAIASFEIAQYGNELDVPADRFVLIPNGCDLPEASGQHKRSGNLIASVGRLERYKGHHRLIAAMPYILEQKPDARLWIAGSGPYEPELRRLVASLKLNRHVEIRAIPSADREAMAEELSKVSLVALLSDFETHPLSVLEALSMGIPAMVTRTSGLAELAEKGLARGIPLASSPREIATAVIEQLDHPMVPPRLDLDTWDGCTQSLLSLYKDIIGLPDGEIHANPHAHAVLSPDLRRD